MTAALGRLGTRLEQRWRRSSTSRSVIEVMVAAFALHVGTSRVLHLPAAAGRYELLIGVAYFVFGLYSAFTIESSRSRLARINELLKGGDGDLISVYRLGAAFEDQQPMLHQLIDHHLQEQIDYRLVDFEASGASLHSIEAHCMTLEPVTPRQELALDHLLSRLVELRRGRQQLEALVRQRVTPVEWGSLLFLLAALWALMLAASGGPIIASVLGAALIASLVGTMVVLWHLDTLKWQEGDWIWRPLHSMFRSLDLLPYYHRDDLRDGRMQPPSYPVRVVSFPHDYPDLSGKAVEIIGAPPADGF